MSLSESRISINGKAAKTPVFAAFLANPVRINIYIIAFFSNKSNLCLDLWASYKYVVMSRKRYRVAVTH
jgi:hypothetical protein